MTTPMTPLRRFSRQRRNFADKRQRCVAGYHFPEGRRTFGRRICEDDTALRVRRFPFAPCSIVETRQGFAYQKSHIFWVFCCETFRCATWKMQTRQKHERWLRITEFVLPDSFLTFAAETYESGNIVGHEFAKTFRALLTYYMRERCVSFLAEASCLRVIQALEREQKYPRFRNTLYSSIRWK